MKTSKFLPILALAGILAVPAAALDQGHGKAKGKNKDKDKDKHSQVDRKSDRDRDWDRDGDWDHRWDDDGAGGMRFRGMDRNGDGRISRSEWRGNDRSFANHDWNGDGILSGSEVRPAGKWDDNDWNGERGWRDRFYTLDRNDDNYLSRAEWPGADRLFNLLDLNRDGRVSFAEVQDHYRNRR